METLAVIQGEADNEAVNDELSVWRPDKDGLSVGEIELHSADGAAADVMPLPARQRTVKVPGMGALAGSTTPKVISSTVDEFHVAQ